jgi:hypothetical protein
MHPSRESGCFTSHLHRRASRCSTCVVCRWRQKKKKSCTLIGPEPTDARAMSLPLHKFGLPGMAKVGVPATEQCTFEASTSESGDAAQAARLPRSESSEPAHVSTTNAVSPREIQFRTLPNEIAISFSSIIGREIHYRLDKPLVMTHAALSRHRSGQPPRRRLPPTDAELSAAKSSLESYDTERHSTTRTEASVQSEATPAAAAPATEATVECLQVEQSPERQSETDTTEPSRPSLQAAIAFYIALVWFRIFLVFYPYHGYIDSREFDHPEFMAGGCAGIVHIP